MSSDDPGAQPRGARLGRVVQFLFDTVPRAIIGTLILIGVAIIFANVIGRYLFGAAIFWAEEILIFMVVGLVSVSAIAVSFNGAHLRMDLLLERVSGRARRLIEGLTTLSFIVCCAFVAVQSFAVVSAFSRTGTVSLTAGVPLVVPHTVLLVGFVLMIVAVGARAMLAFRGRPRNGGPRGADEGDDEGGSGVTSVDRSWPG